MSQIIMLGQGGGRRRTILILLLVAVIGAFLLVPRESEVYYKLKGWFTTDEDPEDIVVVTTTVTVPPVTETIVETPATVTKPETVVEREKMASGSIDVRGAAFLLSPNEYLVDYRPFMPYEGIEEYIDPEEGEYTELEMFHVAVYEIRIEAQNLDHKAFSCTLWVRYDFPDGTHKTLDKYDVPRSAFKIQGDPPRDWIGTTGETVWVFKTDLIDDVGKPYGIPYKHDGTEWHFRLKAKVRAPNTFTGEDMSAWVNRSFDITTDWCSSCGGKLVLMTLSTETREIYHPTLTTTITTTKAEMILHHSISEDSIATGVPNWVFLLIVGLVGVILVRRRRRK